VRESLAQHLETRTEIAPGYGYQWWIDRVDGAPQGPLPVTLAIGNGGQRVFLLPGLRTVVVVTAGSYDAADQGVAGRRVLAAVVDAAAPAPAARGASAR
jgi:CubicO group peptidase (beta-lactamase class C family)